MKGFLNNLVANVEMFIFALMP